MPSGLYLVAAVSDAWIIGFGIFQLLFSAAVSFAIYKLTTAQRRNEGLEERLHELTTKLVDERFRGMSHLAANSVQGLVTTAEELKRKLEGVDGVIGTLASADHANELKTIQRMNEIKDWIRDYCASKGDVQRHEAQTGRRLDALNGEVKELGKEVAVLAAAQQKEAR